MVIPSSLPRRSPRSDHVQALWSWSADFSIGTGCAFDGTGSGSNDDFGFNTGRPWLFNIPARRPSPSTAFCFVGYPSRVEELDRTLKAWVQEYGQPGGSSGLGNPGKLDVILAQPKNRTK